jgi:hypothetical protein
MSVRSTIFNMVSSVAGLVRSMVTDADPKETRT